MDSSKPILLIDTSYNSFYRFHATVFWFKKAHAEEYKKIKSIEEETKKEYEWINNKIFMDKFKLMYLKGIEAVLSKYKLDIPYQNFIFGLDCSRKDIWRRKLYPTYKIQRDYTNWSGCAVLKYAHSILLQELSKKYNINILIQSHLEADDILAITKKYIREKTPKKEVIIITNDNDYLQLIDNHTLIINLQKKLLNDRSCGDAKKDLLIKILCGDPADNIKGCFKRCGIKTATKYCNNYKLLENAFIKNPESKGIYKLNRTLIDFSFIPEELQKKVLIKIKTIIK